MHQTLASIKTILHYSCARCNKQLWFFSLYFIPLVGVVNRLDLNIANCCICLIDVQTMYMNAIEDVAQKLKDRQATYIAEAHNEPSAGERQPVVIPGTELDLHAEISSANARESSMKSLSCSCLCSKAEELTSFTSVEEV
jgi:hypothetical protein